jgi:hypothetical protein
MCGRCAPETVGNMNGKLPAVHVDRSLGTGWGISQIKSWK